MKNRLYYGDNLEILRNREYFRDECVDLIYLDQRFNYPTLAERYKTAAFEGMKRLI